MSTDSGTMLAWTKTKDEQNGMELIEHKIPTPGPGKSNQDQIDLYMWN